MKQSEPTLKCVIAWSERRNLCSLVADAIETRVGADDVRRFADDALAVFGAFEPPIEYEPLLAGDKERDIQIITQEIVSHMEDVIRRYPDQWYMFRQMWPRTDRHNAEIRRRNLRGASS